MKTCLPFTLLICFATTINAQSVGPNRSTQSTSRVIAGGTQAWNSSASAAASDDSYAYFDNLVNTAGAHTDYLNLTGFNFSIPSTMVITGVQVNIERSDPNQQSSDYSIRLIKNGAITGTDKSLPGTYPAADAIQTYGGVNDLWGTTLSFKDIAGPAFGIAIAVQRTGLGDPTMGRIDDVSITIFYKSAVTLPVSINSFNATRNSNSVDIRWTASEESQIDRYEVERSTNSNTFSTIGIVRSGNVTGATSYSFADRMPAQGLSYYRLKIIDQNVGVKYSSIVTINLTGTGNNNLYPTLINAGQPVYITNPTSEKLSIELINNTGQLVERLTSTSGQLGMSSSIPAGTFFYRVSNSKGITTGSGRIVID